MATKRITTAYVAMNPSQCKACWACIEKCPKKVIDKTGFFLRKHIIFKNGNECIGCGKCIETCTHKVIYKLDKTVTVCKQNSGISFYIEQLLPVAFIALALTGIGLHIVGHNNNEVCHHWKIAHISASSFWLLSVTAHIKHHIRWYKTLTSKGITSKQWITSFLSILFLITSVTGIMLIVSVKNEYASIVLLHYKLGVLMLIFSLIHSLYRK